MTPNLVGVPPSFQHEQLVQSLSLAALCNGNNATSTTLLGAALLHQQQMANDNRSAVAAWNALIQQERLRQQQAFLHLGLTGNRERALRDAICIIQSAQAQQELGALATGMSTTVSTNHEQETPNGVKTPRLNNNERVEKTIQGFASV